jgi:predicted TIM-barrel fold metal-dependent hydrolase
MKIDIFTHILPKKYLDRLLRNAREGTDLSLLKGYLAQNPLLSQINLRLQIMDRDPDVVQALTIHVPPLEMVVPPAEAVELARIANDEMAELLVKHPDRFIAAGACLPMNDIDAALKEADRAINELHFRGIQLCTHINGETLGTPQFRPLYALMAGYDLPIWIHPWSPPGWGATPFQDGLNLGWPYQTSLAMVHLARAKVFEEYPNIKFITHHCGGMIPSLHGRVRDAVDGLRKFYTDTCLSGNAPGLMNGYAFFGSDHIVFGTDMPWGSQSGDGTARVIRTVEAMAIPEADKKKIFEDNARQVLRLPV